MTAKSLKDAIDSLRSYVDYDEPNLFVSVNRMILTDVITAYDVAQTTWKKDLAKERAEQKRWEENTQHWAVSGAEGWKPSSIPATSEEK